jgi:hypothetical protein
MGCDAGDAAAEMSELGADVEADVVLRASSTGDSEAPDEEDEDVTLVRRGRPRSILVVAKSKSGVTVNGEGAKGSTSPDMPPAREESMVDISRSAAAND